MSDCGCHFEARDNEQRNVLWLLLAINGTLFAAEIIVGWIAESAGVIADSLDMLADASVYGLGLYAIGHGDSMKRRAARWSGIFQILLAASILVEVARRAVTGSDPDSGLMVVISMLALAGNTWCLKLLSKHRDGEVHMRASWIFSRSDVIANLGVILAGVLVALTGSGWPDLVVGAAIILVVLHGARAILREAKAPKEDRAG